MKIEDSILEPYCILVEEDNFTLGIPKEYPQKNGTILYQMHNANYFQSFDSALKKLVKIKLANDESVVDLKTYLKRFQEINKEVEQKLKQLL
jgi:hypothetical protein